MAFNCTSYDNCVDTVERAIANFTKRKLKEPLIDDSSKRVIEICVHVTLFIATSAFGIVANIINIIVYWKQGLNESITLGFFVLSISDLFIVFNSFITSCWYAAKFILPDSSIDFTSVHYVTSGSLRNMGYSISSVLLAFLSLERCCCVVLPFKVKLIFTISRTKFILAAIFVTHIVCYIPYFATQSLRWKPYIMVNGTMTYKLRVHFSEYRPVVEKVSNVMLGVVTPTTSQVIVSVCAVVLVNGLRASSRFRTSMMQVPVQGKEVEAKSEVSTTSDGQVDNANSNNGKPGQGHTALAPRDARLVKGMVFLVAIMSISNVPLLMIIYAQSLIPELNMGQAYHNTFSTSYSIVYVLSSLNASLNIFVYYHTSSKYREILTSVLQCQK